MKESVLDQILSFDRSGKLPGKAAAAICASNSFEELESCILDLLKARNYDRFVHGLEFAAFLNGSTAYIPGNKDDLFVQFIREKGRVEGALWDVLLSGHYARAVHVMDSIRHLPLVLNADRYERLVRTSVDRNPLLMKEIINYHMTNVDKAFPFSLVGLIDYDDPAATAIAQYNIAEYSEADSTAKVELFVSIRKVFPEFKHIVDPRLHHWRLLNETVEVSPGIEDETQASGTEYQNAFDTAIFSYFEGSVNAMSEAGDDPDYFDFMRNFEELT